MNKTIAILTLTHSIVAYGNSDDRKLDINLASKGLQGLVLNYNKICTTNTNLPYSQERIKDICHVVVNSELCQNVQEENRLKCDSLDQNLNQENAPPKQAALECMGIIYESAIDAMKYMGEILKWIVRKDKDLSESGHTIQLYLFTEFSKAYKETSPPFRVQKTFKKVGKNMLNAVADGISEIVQKRFDEYGCLSFNARTNIICQVFNDIFIPPSPGICLMENGYTAAVKAYPKLKHVFTKLNKYKTFKDKVDDVTGKAHIGDIDNAVVGKETAVRKFIEEEPEESEK